MFTLMMLTALGTAAYIVFGAIGLLIRVFGRAFGVMLGLASLVPIGIIFLIGSGITFLPVFMVAALIITGLRRLACR